MQNLNKKQEYLCFASVSTDIGLWAEHTLDEKLNGGERMKIKFCGKCGRELTEGSGFCQFCGWKVVRLESEDIDSDRESPLVNSPDEPTRINPAETAGEKSETLPLNTSLSPSQKKKKFPLPILIGVVLLITAGMILWQTIFKSA